MRDEYHMSAPSILVIDRNARVFTAGPERTRALAAQATVHRLMAGQHLLVDDPADIVVRQGSVRVREQLADGRKVTRAVLQTGMLGRVMPTGAPSAAGGGQELSAERCQFNALGESEVWVLPPGSVPPHLTDRG